MKATNKNFLARLQEEVPNCDYFLSLTYVHCVPKGSKLGLEDPRTKLLLRHKFDAYNMRENIVMYENQYAFYEEIQKVDVFSYVIVTNGKRRVEKFSLKPSQRGLTGIPSEVVDLYFLLYEAAHFRTWDTGRGCDLQCKPRNQDLVRSRQGRGVDSHPGRDKRRAKRGRTKASKT